MSQTYVTRPSLPPLDEFVTLLEQIWSTRQLTNNGPFHQAFESALADYLGVPYVSLFCNGMMALQVGLQTLKITGEVITSPYTFPATTHAIYWNHCTPVFCDTDQDTCNLDPEKIESLITPKTT
ncbi:MAG: aminotransferase class I/II-fold pyridoxal phosphate-dependent enzyme, partial [Candidatus Thiodiazotropha sp. 6PLUC5]